MDVEGGALMAIVALVKVTLCGPAAEKEGVLDGLQQLGCLHLNDLGLKAGEAGAPEPSYQEARQALQYLRDSPVRRRVPRRTGDVDLECVVKEALEVRDRSRALSEEREQLGKCIADLEPWGNFELPQWAKEGSLRFWFYIVPHHRMPSLDGIALPWKVVARDHRFAYAVLVAGEQPTNMPVAPTLLDPRSLAKIRKRLGQVEWELEELDYRRIGLTIHANALREALQETDDRIARARCRPDARPGPAIRRARLGTARASCGSAEVLRGAAAGLDDRAARPA
jgi:V/A-type H+/Na+-transporting ATPase subunit I